MNKISVAFDHGLGDCSNFAHQIPLWIRRGYTVDVQCAHDKAPLFIAAGASIVPRAKCRHEWYHAGAPGEPTFDDHYSGNKSAWNLQHSVMPPLSYREVWEEHCAVRLNLDSFVTDLVHAKIQRFIEKLDRPLVLVHPQGNTSPQSKNLPDGVFIDLVAGMIDRVGGCIVTLDWDNRCSRIWNHHTRHLGDDLGSLSTSELYCLMRAADLYIGIDSGPAHLLRFTTTPGLVVWHANYCSHFILPRTATVNLSPSTSNKWNSYRRIPYNIVEYDRLDGDFVAGVGAAMLVRGRYVPNASANAVLAGLLRRCRLTGLPYNQYVDRHRTFDLFLRHALTFENPTIIETGCMRAAEDYSAGMSTYLFAYYLMHSHGRMTSVDCTPKHVETARKWTRWADDVCDVVNAHSHDFFRSYTGPRIDCLYLDSADVDTPGYQECCLQETQLASPHLHENSCILIDDTPFKNGRIDGKGALAVPWLLEQGWKVDYAGYQVLLKKQQCPRNVLPRGLC